MIGHAGYYDNLIDNLVDGLFKMCNAEEEENKIFTNDYYRFEKDGKIIYSVKIPGIKQEDLKISVLRRESDGDIIKIFGETVDKLTKEKYLKEINIKTAFIEAEQTKIILENGILYIETTPEKVKTEEYTIKF